MTARILDIKTDKFAYCPMPKKADQQTQLVAHWMKDPDGKLYQYWAKEVVC